MHDPGFTPRDGATRNPPIDLESGGSHPFSKHIFHFVIGSLDCVAWLLGGTDIGAEVNPSPTSFDQIRAGLDVGFDAELAKFVPTGGDEQHITGWLHPVHGTSSSAILARLSA